MAKLLKQIKTNFLNKNSFNVGFNNKTPVPLGMSRNASPLGYTAASASFSGPNSVMSSYNSLMQSHYGQPEIPDNAEMGDVLSKAVGQVGYMAASVGDAIDTAVKKKKGNGDDNGDEKNEDENGNGPARKSSKSPLNQNGDGKVNKYDYVDPIVDKKKDEEGEGNEGEGDEGGDHGDGGVGDILDDDKPSIDLDRDFCIKNPTHIDCIGKSYQKKTEWSDLTPGARIQKMNWW